MNITLTISYDNDGNFKLIESDSGDEITYGEITDSCRTIELRLQLPEVQPQVVKVKIPESVESDITATVNLE